MPKDSVSKVKFNVESVFKSQSSSELKEKLENTLVRVIKNAEILNR